MFSYIWTVKKKSESSISNFFLKFYSHDLYSTDSRKLFPLINSFLIGYWTNDSSSNQWHNKPLQQDVFSVEIH